MSKRLRRFLLAIAVLVPAAAFAHAHLRKSTPADGARLRSAPRAIELEFTEAPDLSLTTLKLTSPDGSAVKLGPIAVSARSDRVLRADIRDSLVGGKYTVEWATAARDGHPSRGAFSFFFEAAAVIPSAPAPVTAAAAPTAPPPAAADEGFGVESPAYVIIRWIEFIALIVIIGAVSFRQLVLSFLKRKEEPDSAMIPGAAANAARFGQLAAALLLAVVIARLIAQSYMMHGGMGGVAPRMLWGMVAETRWGQGWIVQLAGTAVAGLGFYKARYADSSRWWLVATVGAIILAVSPALSGHAASSPRFAVAAVIADSIHVFAAGGWLGSLLMVLAAGIPAALRLPENVRGAMVAEVVNAFSPTALTFAGAIAATGVFAAWLHLDSLTSLWTSTYGKTLIVKLVILSIVAVTGAYNWLRVKPHLERPDGAMRMTRSGKIELAVGVLVVLATAVLVGLSTPQQ